jgi:HEAT repeat protein
MIHTRKHRFLLTLIFTATMAALFVFFTADRERGVTAQDLNKLNRFVQSSNAGDAAMRVFRDGRDRIADEDWGAAAKRFRDFITDYPKHKDVDAAHYWLAFALKKQGKLSEAGQQLDRLVRDYPRSNWMDDARAMKVEIAGPSGDTSVIQAELDKDDQEMKMIALQSLFQADPERASALVADLLKPDSKASRRLKETAIALLGQHHNTRTTATLMELARSQNDAKLRHTAIFWLGQSQDENAIKLLEDLAAKTDDVETAKSALFALTQTNSGRARETLLNVARNSPSVEMRKQAIFWLGNQGGDAAVDDLLKIYESESNIELKKQVLFALSQNSSPRAQARLMEVARTDPNSQTRQQAIFWIGQRGDDQSLETLIQMYDAEKDAGVKDKLIFAFSQSNKKAALQKLMQIARSDASVEMRKKAVFWLGQKRDPEATKFLEEILK